MILREKYEPVDLNENYTNSNGTAAYQNQVTFVIDYCKCSLVAYVMLSLAGVNPCL